MDWKTGRGNSAPATRPGPTYRVLIPKPGDPVICRVLDHDILGVDCHWLKASPPAKPRTIGCIAGSGCQCEQTALPYKWHGYLCVSLYSKPECVILSLTERGRIALLDIAGDVPSLRGIKLSVRRATDHPSSRLLLHVLAEDKPGLTPPTFDPMPTLTTLYGPRWADHFMGRNRGKDGAS